MHTVALRDLQQKGLKALAGMNEEPVLLQNRSGISYFLVPVQENDLEIEYRELIRALALSNLRRWQMRSQELGLDSLTIDEINEKIAEIRKSRKHQAKI